MSDDFNRGTRNFDGVSFEDATLPSGYKIAENGSGDLVIKDTNGNTVFRWDSSAGEWNIESNALTNISSVSADGIDITNETYIEGELRTDKTGVSSGTFTNIIGTEVKDVKNELNSSFEFVPDETAKYDVYAQAAIGGSVAGDFIQFRLHDNTNNKFIVDDRREVADIDFPTTLQICTTVTLTAGDTYVLEARNFNSTFDLKGSGFLTRGVIKKSVVHP